MLITNINHNFLNIKFNCKKHKIVDKIIHSNSVPSIPFKIANGFFHVNIIFLIMINTNII